MAQHWRNGLVFAITIWLPLWLSANAAGRRTQELAVSVDVEGSAYRLYAAYKDKGTMACSFDSGGNGVVNTKAGQVCFSHNNRVGGSSGSLSWGPNELPPQDVEIQLDDHLGFRYALSRAM